MFMVVELGRGRVSKHCLVLVFKRSVEGIFGQHTMASKACVTVTEILLNLNYILQR